MITGQKMGLWETGLDINLLEKGKRRFGLVARALNKYRLAWCLKNPPLQWKRKHLRYH